MSKITFRADEDLIERVERLDASKSEVMRDALRTYLVDGEPARGDHPSNDGGSGDRSRADVGGWSGSGDARGSGGAGADDATLDDLVAERVDAMLDERLGTGGQDIDLTISLEGVHGASVDGADRTDAVDTGEENAVHTGETDTVHTGEGDAAYTGDADEERIGASPGKPATSCDQCGTDLDPGHVHCPNCGEKATHRVFCDCGDELRSDWAFCPSCGRRTPAADVLDSG